jgi:hypothetical protein
MQEEPEKNTPTVEPLENTNSELFNSFNPEVELWVVGGSNTISDQWTYQPDSSDNIVDYDISW